MAAKTARQAGDLQIRAATMSGTARSRRQTAPKASRASRRQEAADRPRRAATRDQRRGEASAAPRLDGAALRCPRTRAVMSVQQVHALKKPAHGEIPKVAADRTADGKNDD